MTTTRLLLLLLPALLAACAEGGDEDRPQSEVTVAASHHLFGFKSLRGFGSFPVPTSAVLTDSGLLNLFDDSTYTVSRPSGTTSADRYAIENDGATSVFVAGAGTEPSVVFLGGYSLVGTQADYFFTDRISTPNGASLGFFFGTRVIPGDTELEGNWHLLSLHTIFDATIPAPDNVGQGARGSVSISAGGAGTQRTISGTGMQFTSALTLGGTIQDLGDGDVSLTVNYQLSGQAADSRVMLSAANANVVYGLDADETDGEAGLLVMLRKFDAPTTPVDPVRVAGTFLVGGHTLFVNPTNSGSDVFVGVAKLTSGGGFTLDATGNSGADFSYSGTYTLAADGGMTLSISGTNETWFAAIDRTYNTLAFVDDFEEIRSNNIPELNFGFGVRQRSE